MMKSKFKNEAYQRKKGLFEREEIIRGRRAYMRGGY